MRPPARIVPGAGQESVWDYPRPPEIRPEPRTVTVTFGGAEIARSERAVKVCETAGPPVVYLRPDDVDHEALVPAQGETFCEWKGSASYYDVIAPEQVAERAAWAYRSPTGAFSPIRDWIAFYPARVECRLGGERVGPQPGEFYGGWVTAEISGPFKGGPDSLGW